jgi:hypothetical protein
VTSVSAASIEALWRFTIKGVKSDVSLTPLLIHGLYFEDIQNTGGQHGNSIKFQEAFGNLKPTQSYS